MNTINYGNTQFTCPATYNELSAKAYLSLCKILQTPSQFIRFQVLHLLLCPPGTSKKLKRTFFSIPAHKITYLANDPDITDWVFEPAKLSQYKIQKFKHRNTTFYGPHEDILNTTIAEWVEAIIYFTAYIQSLSTDDKPDTTLLDKMIAVLYRPSITFYNLRKISKNFNIDRRQASNPYRFKKNLSKIHTLPSHIKLSIFLQFEGAYSNFASQFPDAFKNKNNTNTPADTNAWISLIMAMSSDIFGNYQQTQQTDAYTFFTRVNANIRQAEELNEKYKTKKY